MIHTSALTGNSKESLSGHGVMLDCIELFVFETSCHSFKHGIM